MNTFLRYSIMVSLVAACAHHVAQDHEEVSPIHRGPASKSEAQVDGGGKKKKYETKSTKKYRISENNPLYPYAFDDSGEDKGLKSRFEIDMQTLKDYYQYVSAGRIFPNEDAYVQGKKVDGERVDVGAGVSDLSFKVNLDKMIFEPIQPLSAESAQSLFSYDYERVVEEQQTEDFLSAKLKKYEPLYFDQKTQLYQRQFVHMSDWKSLFHSPLREINDDNVELFYKRGADNSIPKEHPLYDVDFHNKMDYMTDSYLTKGNELKMLVNMDSYKQKLAHVRNAERSILVAVMTFANDRSSQILIDAMIDKAKEGKDVKVILEKVWTLAFFRKTLERMRKGGIKVLLSNELLKQKDENQSLFHNKFWIFDEEVAIMGGQNIVNSANEATGFNHWNKDTDVRIEGPTVTDVLGAFTVLWDRFDPKDPRQKKIDKQNLDHGKPISHYVQIYKDKIAQEKRKLVRGSANYADWLKDEDQRTTGLCRYIIQGAQTDKHNLSEAYAAHFETAQKYVSFISQHVEYDLEPKKGKELSWENKFFAALFNKAAEGVHVDLLANGIDGGFAEIGQNIAKGKKNPKREARRKKRANRREAKGKDPRNFLKSFTKWLGLKSTKKFNEYLIDAQNKKNFDAWMHFQYIHSKTAQIDNILASIGSFNFEPYSANSSHESAVFCLDKGLAKDLKYDNIRDMVNSTPVFRE